MKTYLVTGGAGFIGSNFINYLFDNYDEQISVINIDKLTYAGNLNNLKSIQEKKNYRFVKCDICDRNTIERIFSENNIDYVVNFAAESHVDRSITKPDVFITTNVIGTQVMLDAAKKSWETESGFAEGKKFLQVSTDEVYGSLENMGYFTEATSLDPHSPYSASKASADLLVNSYYCTYNMPVNITRCSNNYGPYQFPEKLIPLIINNCLLGKALPVYGTGENVRDWLYVEDHCRAIDLVIRNGAAGEIYNIGGNNEKQNIGIINIIIDTLNEILPAEDRRKLYINRELIRFVEDRKGHDRRYAIDASKIKNNLGWSPDTAFEHGIVKTIRWYLENEDWLKDIATSEYQNYYEQMYGKLL